VRARVLLVVLALSTAAACGGSSGGDSKAAASPSPSPVDTAAATAAITTTWETFFKGGGAVAAHAALLEDGQKFLPELTAQAKDPNNAALTAKVKNVAITGDTAVVTYDLAGQGGTVLLPNASGQAVQVAGAWKVAKKTYCQLISLQDPNAQHPACTTG
jgi:hypothetical protein